MTLIPCLGHWKFLKYIPCFGHHRQSSYPVQEKQQNERRLKLQLIHVIVIAFEALENN